MIRDFGGDGDRFCAAWAGFRLAALKDSREDFVWRNAHPYSLVVVGHSGGCCGGECAFRV
jgi:hypothetical protein